MGQEHSLRVKAIHFLLSLNTSPSSHLTRRTLIASERYPIQFALKTVTLASPQAFLGTAQLKGGYREGIGIHGILKLVNPNVISNILGNILLCNEIREEIF